MMERKENVVSVSERIKEEAKPALYRMLSLA
jgi:quinolinate synthase